MDDQGGWIAQKLDFLFGVGWSRKVARLGSLVQFIILSIATGGIVLDDQTAKQIPFFSAHWKTILAVCLLANKIISWYQAEHQASAIVAVKAEVESAK